MVVCLEKWALRSSGKCCQWLRRQVGCHPQRFIEDRNKLCDHSLLLRASRWGPPPPVAWLTLPPTVATHRLQWRVGDKYQGNTVHDINDVLRRIFREAVFACVLQEVEFGKTQPPRDATCINAAEKRSVRSPSGWSSYMLRFAISYTDRSCGGATNCFWFVFV